MDHRLRSALLAGLLAAMVVTGSSAHAQFDLPGTQGSGFAGLGGPQEEAVIQVSGQFTAPVPATDRPAYLFITVTLKPGWHIYSITQAPGGPITTKIKLDESPAYKVLGNFRPLTPPERKKEPIFEKLPYVETHHDHVTWYAPIEFSPEAGDLGSLKIQGAVFAQACRGMATCLMPQDYRFTASLGPGMAIPAMGQTETPEYGSLMVQLAFAFLGGLILNLMPCVLPVISLKILSFLEQGGESRGRVFVLNLWYCAGVMAVFMVLAALAATAGLAWGEQFTLPWFKVAMTALVFVMALSFLGVWEIPIPGFIGRGGAGQLQTKEGVSGAFFKGAFATVLATPCSGPFLGPVFGYLLGQPPFVAYWIFGAVGLGMAFPYLVIGAFPDLIRFLPKPGAWMETLKQVMAFFLLGTVVYLFTTLNTAYFVPTLTLLVGLWLAAWWIGRTPLTVGPARRAAVWVASSLVAAAVGYGAFTLLLHQPLIAWKPYSAEAVEKARKEGYTVMVDFTADWCPTCKYNLHFAIDTKPVNELVKKNNVLPLLADWTDRSPTIKQALNDLGRNSIPVLAIWPADSLDDKPILLTDLISQREVLEALEKAGPSRANPPQSDVATQR